MENKFLWIAGAILAVIIVLGCIGFGQKETEKTDTTLPTDNEKVTETVTNIEVATPQPVTAKTWYPIAKARALEWNTQAKIIGAIGDNKNGASFLPADGTSMKWKYTFVSVPLLKKTEIVVEDGKIISETVSQEGLAKMQHELSPGEAGFVVDSSRAIQTTDASSEVVDYKVNFKPGKVTYLLVQDGMNEEHPSLWSVSYFPTVSTSILVKYVDATDGSLV